MTAGTPVMWTERLTVAGWTSDQDEGMLDAHHTADQPSSISLLTGDHVRRRLLAHLEHSQPSLPTETSTLASAVAALAERDSIIGEFADLIALRGATVRQLVELVADRDREIYNLRLEVAQRDGALGELRAAIAARSGSTAGLPGFVELPADASLADLRERYAELDRYLSSLLGEPDRNDGETFYDAVELVLRGSEETISERQANYLPYLALTSATQAQPILDIGCGRGEFIELLVERDIPCIGIDISRLAIERLRQRGHEVYLMGGVEFLEGRPDASLAAISAFQVVEHLDHAYLQRLLALAHSKLVPGGQILLETVNPYCLEAFRSYYLDYSHRNPLPKDLLLIQLKYAGFRDARAFYQAPVPTHTANDDEASWPMRFLDYALLARK